MHRFDKKLLQRIANRCTPELILQSGTKEVIAPFISLNGRKASIFVPLCNCNGEAALLYTLRSDKVSTHKSEVSFPGGHIGANESAIEAAIRETREELGDEVGPLTVLAPAQNVSSINGTMVTPIIGFIENDVGDLTHLRPSESEVSQVFVRTISQLNDPSLSYLRQYDKWLKPIFIGGPAVIWGFTAYITNKVLHLAIMPEINNKDDEMA